MDFDFSNPKTKNERRKMKCDNCGKEVKFILAWKVKNHSGHYCSKECAHEATYSTDYERGGILELVAAIFMLVAWMVKMIYKGTSWSVKKIIELIKAFKRKRAAAAVNDLSK